MSTGISCSYVPMCGETEYDPDRYIPHISFDEQLDALGRAVDAGKVSNDNIKVSCYLTYYLRVYIPVTEYNYYCRSDTSD